MSNFQKRMEFYDSHCQQQSEGIFFMKWCHITVYLYRLHPVFISLGIVDYFSFEMPQYWIFFGIPIRIPEHYKIWVI